MLENAGDCFGIGHFANHAKFPGDFMVVPRTVEHRPRSLTDQPVVLMFESSTTLNTGNADSDLTIRDLKRLEPV